MGSSAGGGQAAQLRIDLDPCSGCAVISICRAVPWWGLRWAGDPEGDAPFVEADPAQPEKIIGFDAIDQSIRRGDADFGLSGIEDTQVRRETMTATVPTTGCAEY